MFDPRPNAAEEIVLIDMIDTLCCQLKEAERKGHAAEVLSLLGRLEEVLEDYRRLRQSGREAILLK